MDALQGLEGLLREVIVDLEEQGEQVPQPFAERSYSGKFNLRLGESLHREPAIHAAEDGMSLNQYVLRELTAASPPAPVWRRDTKDPQRTHGSGR